MTWRVLTTPASEPDFQALTAQDRASVVEDLFAWVEDGPPRSGPRLVRGAVLDHSARPLPLLHVAFHGRPSGSARPAARASQELVRLTAFADAILGGAT